MKRKTQKRICIFLCVLLGALFLAPACFAADTGVTALDGPLNNLYSLLVAITRIVGAIMLVWGIVQLGISFPAHDTTQRLNAVLFIVGGALIFFVKEIVAFLGMSI